MDLPEEGREAAGAAINLPEVFSDFDAALPEFGDYDNLSQMAMNQSRIDDITMKEDLPTRSGLSDIGVRLCRLPRHDTETGPSLKFGVFCLTASPFCCLYLGVIPLN